VISRHERHLIRDFGLQEAFELFHSDERQTDYRGDLYANALRALRLANLQTFKPYVSEFLKKLRKKCDAYGARKELDRLLELGVCGESIVAAVFLIEFLPTIDAVFRSFLGDIQDKKRKAKCLGTAANVMEDIAKYLSRGAMDKNDALANNALLSAGQTAESLHFYASAIFFREDLLAALDANSGLEIAKYVFASSIRKITGKYHDREVSGLIGVLLSLPDYDETAHRVWRIRTLRRLNPTCSGLPTLLHALNSAVSAQDCATV
jgi:hypothetical protein